MIWRKFSGNTTAGVPRRSQAAALGRAALVLFISLLAACAPVSRRPAVVGDEGVQALREAELARLLAEQGAPPGLANGGTVSALDGGSFDVAPDARPHQIGAQVAQAVYGGLSR